MDKLLTPELVSQLRSKEFGVSTPEDKLYEEVFRTPAFLKVFKEVIEDYFARPGVLERFKPACNCSAQPCTAECNCAAPSPPTTPTPENVLASASSKHILDALKEISHGVSPRLAWFQSPGTPHIVAHYSVSLSLSPQAIIMENETVLARVAYTLAPGSMVYLNSEDMFYLKTTTTTAAPVPLPDDLVGKSLILAAQNGPLNGELRFGAKFGSGHSGAIFTCQRAARQHNLSQLFYPLMNTDVFNMDYVVPPMYRFDLPIVNIRGEILFDDYVHLVNGEQAPQAPILAFDGKDINSDPLAPCVWVGAKPIYLNGDYEFAARSKCRNWQTHDPTERGLAVHVPMNSNSVGFFDESNLYEESCVKRCNILCIQISPK
ncbi:unnamed protein product [Mesocestoides corti]|uniref:Collagenase NC10/endostatin domain-containing protein n=1 Tax=Mesocestoides corti TaxID=53468 RepID=A0A3P6HTX1_MESCO|nr:unnamed protein product [Mesocestoides corti]